MVHPDTKLQFISDEIGYGVVATRLIPKGTITWVRDRLDQTLTPEEVDRLPPAYQAIVHKYTFLDGKGHYVLCWDLARYINHSCEPTCLSPGYDLEIAVRDIRPGDELTDDYGSLNLEEDFPCSCAMPACRGRIAPGDLLRFADAWDRTVAGPFRLIHAVPQPLWPFVEEADAVDAAIAGRTPIASVRQHYVDVVELHTRRSSAV